MFNDNAIGAVRKTAVAAVAGMFMASAGWASTLTVLADVNADADDSENRPVYQNILGDSTSVLFSRNEEQQDGTREFYNEQAGVTAVEDASTMTSALLANVDLLVISRFFRNAIDYAAGEIDVMADFLSGGGDILIVLESDNSSQLDGYNALLAGLGSDIRYTGERLSESFTDTALEDTAISSTSDVFSVSAYNFLSGGDAVGADLNGDTFLAVETFGVVSEVPLPASLPLLAFALGGFGLAARRKRG